MTDMQTQPGELGPRQKARRTIATLTEAGYVGLPETLVLSAIYDLHERIERLERSPLRREPIAKRAIG